MAIKIEGRLPIAPASGAAQRDDQNPYVMMGYFEEFRAAQARERDELCRRRREGISGLVQQYHRLTKNPTGLATAKQRLETLFPGFYRDCFRREYPDFDTALASWRIDGNRRVSVDLPFWTTPPFQVIGAAQAIKKGVLAVDRRISTTIAQADAKLVAGATTLFIAGASILRYILSRGASAF